MKKHRRRGLRPVLAGLALIVAASVHGTEIYKWIDANGQVHYAERQPTGDAGKPSVAGAPAPATAPAAAENPADYWRERERQFNERQLRRNQAEAASAAAKPRATTTPAGTNAADDPDQARCRLARAILSGSVRHNNGMPIDAYDRQVAENDARTFCH